MYFTAKTLAVSQEGQLTDRFVKSLELLGKHDSIESRLGGVYSLERIARDSQRDHGPIMQILAASARQAPKPVEPLAETSPFVQSVLEVITRRNMGYEKPNDRYLDLRGIAAPKAFLIYSHFVRLNVLQADFSDADLRSATIGDLYGERINLRQAKLSRAQIGTGTNLKSADLAGADLSRSNVQHGYFENAVLENVTLDGAKLIRCNFENAKFT